MARDLVIQAEDVRKRYRLGTIDRSLITENVQALFARMRGAQDPRTPVGAIDQQRIGQYFWALRGVSFELEEGVVLGIIGRNGAGKSTLLKLLSRITLPTSGTIRMRGRVSSLLEVGTGFHPELTGRENIYLNGAILGMRRMEIDRKLEAIIEFSGIKDHIDTPIKRYSSGMKVRLGFAVAAHLDPEVLVVDEVLAVGDAEFQRKCLGAMRNVADEGRTILFVSHNMVSVQSLCDRVLWLDKGMVRQEAGTEEVVRDYLAEYAAQVHEREWTESEAPGIDEVRVLSVRAVGDRADGSFWINEPVRIEIELLNTGLKVDDDLNIRMQVRTHNDMLAFVSGMSESMPQRDWVRGRSKVTCVIPADLLNQGGYRINLLFFRHAKVAFKLEEIINIDVQEGARDGTAFHKWPGALRPHLQWIR